MNPASLGRPRFVRIDEALAWHEIVITRFGGAPGLRDRNLLESALAQAQAGTREGYAHAFPFEMAAAYAFHIAKNHPFVDGNKRVALYCAVAFLRMNGWNLPGSGEVAADQILAMTSGSVDKTAFALWLQAQSVQRPTFELRDFFSALSYSDLAPLLAGMAAGSQDERIATMHEASKAIPAVNQANLGAVAAEAAGDGRSEEIFRHHAYLLAAIYRIGEDMGYDW